MGLFQIKNNKIERKKKRKKRSPGFPKGNVKSPRSTAWSSTWRETRVEQISLDLFFFSPKEKERKKKKTVI